MVSHYTIEGTEATTRPSAGITLGALAALSVVLLLVTVSIMAPAIWPSAQDMRASTMQDETHPVADAGANRTVYVDMNVMLNGSA